MAILPRLAVLLVIALGAGACDDSPPHQVVTRETPQSEPSTVPSTVPSAAQPTPYGCPVTLPGSAGTPQFDPAALYGAGSSYGNDVLWVGGLWPGGVLAAEPAFVDPDGSVHMKFGWYRIATGSLTITGRRLDGPAPALTADVPEGYGASGFQSSGVRFPVEGCWEVTGHVGTGSMSFVTYVLKTPG
jgi:hypothetical protein